MIQFLGAAASKITDKTRPLDIATPGNVMRINDAIGENNVLTVGNIFTANYTITVINKFATVDVIAAFSKKRGSNTITSSNILAIKNIAAIFNTIRVNDILTVHYVFTFIRFHCSTLQCFATNAILSFNMVTNCFTFVSFLKQATGYMLFLPITSAP